MIMFHINKTNQEQDPTTLKIVLIPQKYSLIFGLRMCRQRKCPEFQNISLVLVAETFILFLGGVVSSDTKHGVCQSVTAEQD